MQQKIIRWTCADALDGFNFYNMLGTNTIKFIHYLRERRGYN